MRSLLAVLCVLSTGAALKCYDCFDTSPTHADCTKDKSCNGVACMTFESGDNSTATAFCLLALRPDRANTREEGCWLEPDGKGRHCICHTDHCNELVDRTSKDVPEPKFLKSNPLVDYENPDLDDESDSTNSQPVPVNVLYPSAARYDPLVAGEGEDHPGGEDDLVPIDFEAYEMETRLTEEREKEHVKTLPHDPAPSDSAPTGSAPEVSAASRIPPYILMLLTMAASIARLFVWL